MKISKIVLFIAFCMILQLLLCSCTNSNAYETNITNFNISENEFSYKKQMDIAMKNADNSTVLARVNDIEITQTNKDVYLISDEDYTTEEIVKMVVIEDYAKKHNLKINQNAQSRIDSMRHSMEEDESLTDEYCLEIYGISKEDVITHMINRSYQIWFNAAFSDMVIKEVSNGETPQKYPELKKAYDKYERNKLKNGPKAWDDIEQAYYEMIAKDYDIVIY